jgi:hypothetical protein
MPGRARPVVRQPGRDERRPTRCEKPIGWNPVDGVDSAQIVGKGTGHPQGLDWGPGATVERKAVPGPKRRRRLGDVREFSRGTARRRSHVPCPRSRGVPFSLGSPSPSTTPDTGPALPRAPGLRTSPAANPVSRPTCSRHGPEGTPPFTSNSLDGARSIGARHSRERAPLASVFTCTILASSVAQPAHPPLFHHVEAKEAV